MNMAIFMAMGKIGIEYHFWGLKRTIFIESRMKNRGVALTNHKWCSQAHQQMRVIDPITG